MKIYISLKIREKKKKILGYGEVVSNSILINDDIQKTLYSSSSDDEVGGRDRGSKSNHAKYMKNIYDTFRKVPMSPCLKEKKK